MTNYHYDLRWPKCASATKNKNDTRAILRKIGDILGKQKPGLFSALTLGLVLLIAASALTAKNDEATGDPAAQQVSID